jgi:hypothetical protein
MSENIKSTEGLITAESFAKANNMEESKVIEMIRDGTYVGKIVGKTWVIDTNFSSKNESITSNTGNKNPHQADLNKAQSAFNVGSTLSVISTVIHILLAIIFFVAGGISQQPAYLFLVFAACAGILASWAIIHALLSIVVTNALTAKYMIYNSSKNKG